MFEEIVVKETVNPTDWELTSQKHASLPHVFDRGRYAINAADSVHRRFAAVAVRSRAACSSQPGYEGEGSAIREWRTIRHVENDGPADEQRDDLDGVADGLELRCHGCVEAHVPDDDSGEGVYNTVGDCTAIQSAV